MNEDDAAFIEAAERGERYGIGPIDLLVGIVDYFDDIDRKERNREATDEGQNRPRETESEAAG